MAFNVLKTPQGYLKVVHVIIGAIALGIQTYLSAAATHGAVFFLVSNEVYFFELVTFAFLVSSFLLLISVILDDSPERLGDSHFEALYHLLGFILYFAAAISLSVALGRMRHHNMCHVVPCVLGFVNAIAYAANTFFVLNVRRN